jgi:Asp-tRNA(Asn)/Glu-tRNA(Gln) amidotransferase A subunit family amidase
MLARRRFSAFFDFRGGPMVDRLRMAAVLLLMAVPLDALQQPPGGPGPFRPEEATIAGIHAALAAGQVTCVDVVRAYLRRIDAYDKRGPNLNALITINPRALETASESDRIYRADRAAARPLHCIPIVLKDNYDTADLPTTGGSVTLADSRPLKDARVVQKLREAGAIVLAKANLTELARGGNTVSSLGGQTRNPYDLTRTPGGSSGGTGAAVAAGLAVAGTGTDTGQSVRSPASALALVGLRPTRGLVSRAGIIPVGTTQDEAGPIARTVADAARMLDVMAGYDPDDPVTALGAHTIPPTYTAFLDRDGLKGARVGVLTAFFGHDAAHRDVNAVMDRVMATMTAAGATMVRIAIPRLDALTRDVQVAEYETKVAFNRYLAALGPRAPVKTLGDLIARGEFHPSLKGGLEADQRVVDGLNHPDYKDRLLRRQQLRQAVMNVIAANRLDAILYPHQRRLVARIGEEQLERNGVLSNSTGLPAITFPGGFSMPTSSAPLGVPVGVELLGPEWREGELLRLAYAFEQMARIRQAPRSTPPLGEPTP